MSGESKIFLFVEQFNLILNKFMGTHLIYSMIFLMKKIEGRSVDMSVISDGREPRKDQRILGLFNGGIFEIYK